MKTLALASLVLLPVATFAADTPAWKFRPSFSFPTWENMQPALSLSAPAKPGPVTVTSPAGSPLRADAANIAPPKLVSHLPIVKPSADIDPRMVHAPDPAIDFKLIVKTPAIEPAK